jgi:hypothetical protein
MYSARPSSWTGRTGPASSLRAAWADIIAIDGHPLRDIRTLKKVRFVMKRGVAFKRVKLIGLVRLDSPATRSK